MFISLIVVFVIMCTYTIHTILINIVVVVCCCVVVVVLLLCDMKEVVSVVVLPEERFVLQKQTSRVCN